MSTKSAKKSPKGSSKSATETVALDAQGSRYETVRIEQLVKNGFNPSRMEPDDFNAYVEAIRQSGRPSKPVVVRRLEGGQLEIVDGEHTFRAAKKAGLTEIDVEILDLDDVEARRQCVARNVGGKTSKVRLGALFAELHTPERFGMTLKEIAEKFGLVEGTVRNHIKYHEAYEARSTYAPTTTPEEISRLPTKTVREYVDRPADSRDAWLDQMLDSSAGSKPADPLEQLSGDELLILLVDRLAPVAAREAECSLEEARSLIQGELDACPWPPVYMMAALLPRVSLASAMTRAINSIAESSLDDADADDND